MEALYAEFGRRVRATRKRVGLTQEALANRVALTRTSITNIEQGAQHVKLHTVFTLASALGVKAVDLLPESLDMADDPLEARNLSPKKRAEVKRTLEKLPQEDREWVFRVLQRGKENGASSSS